MLSLEDFLDAFETLIDVKNKYFSRTTLLSRILKRDLKLEKILPDETWLKVKPWGIKTVGDAAVLLLEMLEIITVLIGHNISQSTFVGQRFHEKKFADRIASIKTQDFIFLQNVSSLNLRSLVNLFSIKEDKDCIVVSFKLGKLRLVKRRILLRRGLGCTTTFARKHRAKLRRQPDMGDLTAKYQACERGDLKVSKILDTEVGFDYNKLDEAIKNIFEKTDHIDRGTKAVLIVHKGKIIREVYNNKDTPSKYNLPIERDDINEFTPLRGWSMAKSLTNVMLGAMIQKGYFGNYETFYANQRPNLASDTDVVKEFLKTLKLRTYLPYLSDASHRGFRDIDMNDLLRMSSGLTWEENEFPFDAIRMVCLEEDMAKYAGTKEVESAPGQKWYYSSGTSNLITGAMKSRFMHLDGYSKKQALKAYWEFPHRYIFDPLGMCNTLIQADIEGTYVGSSYCLAPARDWVRLALLFINGGKVNDNDEQILPKGWVDYSSSSVIGDDGEDLSGGVYGGHLWLNQATVKDLDDRNRQHGYEGVPEDMYYFRGLFGQRTFIIPSMDLVVLRMGAADKIGIKKFLKEVVESFANTIKRENKTNANKLLVSEGTKVSTGTTSP